MLQETDSEKSIFLDETDKQILNRLQTNFPIAKNPFALLAREMGMEETEYISRVKKFREKGIIRRIGANFPPAALGYVSTLCGARVPEEKIQAFTDIVNSYHGVTHNYLRDNEVNIWFTMIAPGQEIIEQNVKQICNDTGIQEIYLFPATQVFKISAEFKL